MLETTRGLNGMVTSPHHLASQAGLDVLRAGGTAVEAAIATAAALAVVYPHMTHIGGDAFWLIAKAGDDPIGIDGAGRAGAAVTPAYYASRGLEAIPVRGPLAANTTAGAVSSWIAALEATRDWQEPMPLATVLGPAIRHADGGMRISRSQHDLTAEKLGELADVPGFRGVFLPDGAVPDTGSVLRQPALADTFRTLAEEGLESFYRGSLAARIAADLAAAGSPITAEDLAAQRADVVRPLSVAIEGARLFNMPPPTQGVASLMILAAYDRRRADKAEGFDHIHGLVEATKQAFLVRDAHVGCPSAMTVKAEALLEDGAIEAMAAAIDPGRALPWGRPGQPGDTIWLGVIDGQGRSVSLIQSIFFEFGSGVVLPQTGILWQNRGSSFQLSGAGPRALSPGRKPFHTLNPAMAAFADGRRMVYGCMGGEGQPQTQAAVFTRYAHHGQDLQSAVTAPRWLLGKTWGDGTVSLKMEGRFDPALVEALRAAGHVVDVLGEFEILMGHAGAIVRHPDGRLDGATDPRSDGAVATF